MDISTQPVPTPPSPIPEPSRGFPEPTDQEVKGFWGWLERKQDGGKLLADELHWVKKSLDPVSKDNPNPELIPKWLIQRWRRETEQ